MLIKIILYIESDHHIICYLYNKAVRTWAKITLICLLWSSIEPGHPGEARAHGQAAALLEEDAVRLD